MTFNNHASAIFLLALILFATVNPPAHGQIDLIPSPIRPSPILRPILPSPILPSPIPLINGVSASGNLCCTPTGNCPGQPLSGVLVSLNCSTSLGGSAILIGQNTTDINGFYNITVGNVLGATLSQAGLCNINVQLPLNRTICPVLSTVNGVITGVARPAGLLLTRRFGLVIIITVGPFRIIIIVKN